MSAIIIKDGKTVLTTTLTAAQSRQFSLLAENVRKAQALLLTGNQPHTVYDALTRLEEMLDPTFKARVAAQPRDGSELTVQVFHAAAPVPVQHAALRAVMMNGDYVSLATTLGMVLSLGTPFDHAKDDVSGAWVRYAN